MGRSKNRRKRRNAAEGKTDRHAKLDVEIVETEIAKGYDGLLRGGPEPTIVLGLWAVGAAAATLVGRRVARMATPTTLPHTVKSEAPVALSALVAKESTQRLVVLVLAIEEDDGRGVQEAYALMEGDETLTLLSSVGGHPHGGPMGPYARDATSPHGDPHAVHVEVEGIGIEESIKGDDWVGASACVLKVERFRQSLRFHVRSKDERNDWTVRLDVKVRPE
jgi:hypothetical protein